MRVKFEELVRGADMRHICECAVNPKAVEDDTVERIEEECRHRVARVRNPRRIANGQTPLFDNPLEQRALRPNVSFGVATRYAWHACFAHGNRHMKRNGVVTPCYALPRPADREAHELAATLTEEDAARHAAATDEIRESVLPDEGWDELLAQEDTLALVH